VRRAVLAQPLVIVRLGILTPADTGFVLGLGRQHRPVLWVSCHTPIIPAPVRKGVAGGLQNHAAGEMALSAGPGMAQGGDGTEGAFLAAGFRLASAFGAQQERAVPEQQSVMDSAMRSGPASAPEFIAAEGL
jgi:hypothetical protein